MTMTVIQPTDPATSAVFRSSLIEGAGEDAPALAYYEMNHPAPNDLSITPLFHMILERSGLLTKHRILRLDDQSHEEYLVTAENLRSSLTGGELYGASYDCLVASIKTLFSNAMFGRLQIVYLEHFETAFFRKLFDDSECRRGGHWCSYSFEAVPLPSNVLNGER